MAKFLDAFNSFYKNTGDKSKNVTEFEECISKVPTSLFHYYLLIPSVMTTLILACTMSRKNKWLTWFEGRPGAVFPMNILGKSHRFLYAAAWGSIAFLAADLVLGDVTIVQLSGPAYVTVFNTVLSMIIIGVDYFPMFAALAIESVVGYIVGTAYAWMLLVIQIFKEAECDLVARARLILFFRDLPNLLCLGYLSISLPLRAIQSLRKKSIQLVSSSERVSVLKLTKKAEFSSEAMHVKNLLKPAPLPPEPSSTLKGKVTDMLKTFASNWIYQPKHGFKYSARMLSVMLVGLFLIYKETLELLVAILSAFQWIEYPMQLAFDEIGWSSKANETQHVSGVRDALYLYYHIILNARICFIIAITLTCAGSVLTILHMLSSYRTNLFDLYKGDNTHIPPRDTLPNTSLLIGSIKYAGYQVAYIAWGFILHLVVLFLLTFIINIIISMIRLGFYQWILDILSSSWPAVLMTIFFVLLQQLLSTYAFLQENGEVLAIDNRRVLFSFTFFMFFYNIFLGLLSCLLRLIKSVVIGTIYFPRLDNSALPRRFQMLDPECVNHGHQCNSQRCMCNAGNFWLGCCSCFQQKEGFSNYCGFIHVECAHTHPVMITFLRLLMIDSGKSKSECLEMQDIVVDTNDKENQSPRKSSKIKSRARARWFLLYTLHNNPTLRLCRKSYLDYVKTMQERLARSYKLNTTAMGKLVKSVNNVVMNNGEAESDGEAAEPVGDITNAQANWNALLAMNKFLKQIQKDVAARQKVSVDASGEECVKTNIANVDNVRTKEEDEKKSNISSDASDKELHSGTDVHTKTTRSLWKRGACLSLENRDSVHPASDI